MQPDEAPIAHSECSKTNLKVEIVEIRMPSTTHAQPNAPKMKRKPPQRDSDKRMVSAWVDKKVAHRIKLEAAKLNMNQSDFIRFIVQQALKDDDLKPPMNEL